MSCPTTFAPAVCSPAEAHGYLARRRPPAARHGCSLRSAPRVSSTIPGTGPRTPRHRSHAASPHWAAPEAADPATLPAARPPSSAPACGSTTSPLPTPSPLRIRPYDTSDAAGDQREHQPGDDEEFPGAAATLLSG
ncbi:hypothetical protein ACRAWF_41705 [Streptomyces sp. L7]